MRGLSGFTHASPQFPDSKLNEVPNEDLRNGLSVTERKWVGGTVDDLPEPFRSIQVEIVQSTYAVPIFVDGQTDRPLPRERS